MIDEKKVEELRHKFDLAENEGHGPKWSPEDRDVLDTLEKLWKVARALETAKADATVVNIEGTRRVMVSLTAWLDVMAAAAELKGNP